MVRWSSARIQLTFILLGVLSQTNGRAVVNNQLSAVDRRGSPAFCEPRSLNPALECGCFVYSPYFSSDPGWNFLEDLCLEDLSGDFHTGELRCAAAPYGRGFGRSIQGRARNRLEDRAARFFKNARRECHVSDAPSFSTTSRGFISTTASRSSSGSPVTTVTDNSGSGLRESNHSASRTVISSRSSSLVEIGKTRKPKESLNFSVVYRMGRFRDIVLVGLQDFCIVYVLFEGLSPDLCRF